MATVEYRYELRAGNEILATGHLSREQPLEVGQEIEIAGHLGTVRAVEAIFGGHELHLVVQSRRAPGES
jgi:hypothetical protein